jgi:hypothetical protein
VASLAELDLIKLQNEKKTRYLLASSFTYDRYFVREKIIKNQSLKKKMKILEYSWKYEFLFSHPFIEIKPAYRTFAFSNPTIRIIDISNNSSAPANPSRN